MGRVAIIIGLILVAIGFGWMSLRENHEIVVSDANISRMMDGSIMASATIANGGDPDVLVGASAIGFGHVHFMGAKGDLVVPGGATPILAGDGVHVMMMGGEDMALGELVPLTLTFQNAGKVNARAKIVEPMMDHSGMSGIEAPDILIELELDGAADLNGASGKVKIAGLTIVSRPDDFGHVDAEGHAHVYLNGLKLQRLYEPEFQTGSLSPGDYLLRVTLNSNDHRPYTLDGVPIFADLRFTID